MADFGYDIANYTDVDPLFGDLATFDELLAEAHLRNLKVIIDLVPNHTSDQHPWFVESRASRSNPKRDWYVWRDAKPDGSPPNNWLAVFGGPAWEWDPRTEQYYLHSFLEEQPDLNWRNPAVKAAIFDVTRFWLDRGVDGFRIDVAHYIMKDPELRDNPVNTDPSHRLHKPMGDYDSLLHLHDKGHPDVHDVYRDFRRLLDSYDGDRPRLAIGEIHIFDWQEWASYYGQNLDELHLPFNFRLLGIPWQAQAIGQVVDSMEEVLPPGAWPNHVLGNHDESRLATRYGYAQARLAAMLLLTLRGTPTLYYGDEIGMMDVPVPANQQKDPWGLRVSGLGRDPCRTPMQWSSAPNAGFSSPEVTDLWLPLSADYRDTNVERQLADPTSLLNLYRALLAYRRASPALHSGDYQAVSGVPDDCYVFLRQTAQQRILVVLNFSSRGRRLSLPGLGRGRVTVSTNLDRAGLESLSDLAIRSNEGLIIERP
jgi:glycosidase